MPKITELAITKIFSLAEKLNPIMTLFLENVTETRNALSLIVLYFFSVQENDPFHTDARGFVMTAPLPRVLTVHTPDLVDLIQDPHAQGPVLVHMNAISGYHGQEAGVDHQFIHHEKRF